MVVVDRLAKDWAAACLHLGQKGIDLGLVDLTLVHNEGAAFGMGQGGGLLFGIIALVVCTLAVAWLAAKKRHGVLEVVSLALIVAGGIGNLIDRVATGYVVDFIQLSFIDFPVFNVADVCVTCGVVLFVVALFTSDAFVGQESFRSADD